MHQNYSPDRDWKTGEDENVMHLVDVVRTGQRLEEDRVRRERERESVAIARVNTFDDAIDERVPTPIDKFVHTIMF